MIKHPRKRQHAKKPRMSFVISGAYSASSTDGMNSITGEQDELVSQILRSRPELAAQHSRCAIYRMFERAEIVNDVTCCADGN